jgi:hypothetical protein
MTTITEQIQAQIAEITQPLQDQLTQLDQQIERMEAELHEFRAARTRVRQVLKGLVPSENGTKKKAAATKSALPSPERMEKLRVWLLAHAEALNVNGFSAPSLRRDYPSHLPIGNASGVSAGLRELHEQGFLGLTRVGRGGERFFKVIS